MFEVKVIEDSISAASKRITTFQLTYPRYIHAELLTHRVFSRNASSSRAIPVSKAADRALSEIVEPIFYGLNQPGMQASNECLEGEALEQARDIWRRMAESCAEGSRQLAALGLHKQWANRPTEWFSNISVVLTATEFDNWFELRAHEDAQPEIHELAIQMMVALDCSTPNLLKSGEWHLPYVTQAERDSLNPETARKVSAARCCRVSYLKHDGGTASVEEDLALCDRLAGAQPIHASPFEHQATPDRLVPGNRMQLPHWEYPKLHGNFIGWIQYRKLIENQFKQEEN